MIAYRQVLAMLLGSLLISTVAWADGEPLKERRMQDANFAARSVPYTSTFTRLDADNDGRVSLIEAGNHPLPEPFWMMDRNRDGYLSPQEYRTISN